MTAAASISELVAAELQLPGRGVARALELLAEGATVPFIARYRKEATGGLDDLQLQRIAEHHEVVVAREKRRSAILSALEEQGALTPALALQIRGAKTLAVLEDLYAPYRPKRRTRGQLARERGLLPLAELLLAQSPKPVDRAALAQPYVAADKELPDVDAVWAGARDLAAELIAERVELRDELRRLYKSRGELVVGVARGKSKAPELEHYRDHVGRREPAERAPSHRILAVERGEAAGLLKVQVELEEAAVDHLVRKVVVRPQASPVLAKELNLAIEEAKERLLLPSLESEHRRGLRERAELEAIRVFAKNLEALLLAPPLGGQPVVAIDPGLRTGCKVVALDAQGNLQTHTTIYPHTGDAAAAGEALAKLVSRHRPAAIAVGNGTAGRETEAFVAALKKAGRIDGAVKVVAVSEAGASVYSASEVAREELPDLDVSIRGAVSIGRRLQDPLAELVKIDPQSIGVGQYQHDVDQKALSAALDRVVEGVVNRVGVDLNTASPTLLRYVSGLGPALAKAIVAHRAEHGPFKSRSALKKVPRLGAKAFEQCAGFLRIRGGEQPLDQSAVHPERYPVVAQIARDLGVTPGALVGNTALAAKVEPQRYVDPSAELGLPTLVDIVEELKKPGRDPRAELTEVGFDPEITKIEHLQPGLILNGVVTNVAAFGAFVDVGVHQDGLVHVSELAHRFVKDPAEVVTVGDRVRVKVLTVDLPRKRIGLSIKAAQASPSGERGRG